MKIIACYSNKGGIGKTAAVLKMAFAYAARRPAGRAYQALWHELQAQVKKPMENLVQEIERKFLVKEMPDLVAASSERVRQGYLTRDSDTTELRLREKGGTYYLTLKGGGSTVRTEREAEITKSQFETFWPETEGRRIEKTRWTGELPDGLQFELDVFEGDLAPLVTVEVEFSSLEQAEAFRPPSWFGRELTSDKRYKNKVLAVSGLPQE